MITASVMKGLRAAYQGKCNYGRDKDHNVGGTFLWNSGIRPPVKTHRLTGRSCDYLQGLACRSVWTRFGHGCNLSRRCLPVLMNYRRRIEIVQRSPYIHFVSSMPILLRFVVDDLEWVLVVDKGGFESLHETAWLRLFLHPLSRCWFAVDLIVKNKMTQNIFWSLCIGLAQECWITCRGRTTWRRWL